MFSKWWSLYFSIFGCVCFIAKYRMSKMGGNAGVIIVLVIQNSTISRSCYYRIPDRRYSVCPVEGTLWPWNDWKRHMDAWRTWKGHIEKPQTGVKQKLSSLTLKTDIYCCKKWFHVWFYVHSPFRINWCDVNPGRCSKWQRRWPGNDLIVRRPWPLTLTPRQRGELQVAWETSPAAAQVDSQRAGRGCERLTEGAVGGLSVVLRRDKSEINLTRNKQRCIFIKITFLPLHFAASFILLACVMLGQSWLWYSNYSVYYSAL